MAVAVVHERADEKVRRKPGVSFKRLSRSEGRKLLDQKARHYLHLSGDEFVRAWEEGRFDRDTDRPEVMRVAMLLPLVQ